MRGAKSRIGVKEVWVLYENFRTGVAEKIVKG